MDLSEAVDGWTPGALEAAEVCTSQGKLPVARLISHHINLSEINEAMEVLEIGNASRQGIDLAAEHL